MADPGKQRDRNEGRSLRALPGQTDSSRIQRYSDTKRSRQITFERDEAVRTHLCVVRPLRAQSTPLRAIDRRHERVAIQVTRQPQSDGSRRRWKCGSKNRLTADHGIAH